MDFGDLITKAGAGVGTGLGIFNSWHAWKLRTVNIRAIPTAVKVWRALHQGPTGNPILGHFLVPGVEVINLRSFPVTVKEVGYEVKDGTTHPLSEIDASLRWTQTGAGTIPIVEKLPQRLEPRASLRMAWPENDEPNLRGKQIRRAYVKTVCGTTARARSSALTELAWKMTHGEQVVERVEETP